MAIWPFTRRQPTNLALLERLEAVERKIKALSTDWDETYEKFQRLNARMAQRWRRLQSAEDDDAGIRLANGGEPAESHPPAPNGGPITNPLAIELLRGRK